MKTCQICGKDYVPRSDRDTVINYCSNRCKCRYYQRRREYELA